MIVGLLFISMITAALASAFGLAAGMPLWLGLLLFPVIGSTTLLLFSAAVFYLRSSHMTAEPSGKDMSRDDHATA